MDVSCTYDNDVVVVLKVHNYKSNFDKITYRNTKRIICSLFYSSTENKDTKCTYLATETNLPAVGLSSMTKSHQEINSEDREEGLTTPSTYK